MLSILYADAKPNIDNKKKYYSHYKYETSSLKIIEKPEKITKKYKKNNKILPAQMRHVRKLRQ